MCNALTIFSTAMEVTGQLQQGNAAARQANDEAAQLDYQAQIEQANALTTAREIRRQGATARGQTVAGVAASGVEVGQGSAGDAERLVMQNTESDAYMAILNGENAAKGLRADAEIRRRSGRDAKRASQINAFSTLLSRGAQGLKASGWGSAGPGFSGTQAPAPVETRTLSF